jgi:SAM-dependent methyltransferase
VEDIYRSLAFDYDEFGPFESYQDSERDFFQRLFEQNKVKSILDCACGTGQHLYMLSQLGYQLCGSDISSSMLKVAEKNLKERNQTIPLYQCDFRYLESKFDRQFDAVICLTNALPHLHTDEDLLRAIQSMKNRLNPGGLLIFTSGTTHYTLTLPSIEVVVNHEDFSRVFVKEHDDQFQTIHILDIFHSPQRREHNQYDMVYRILLDDDYRSRLQQAGFSDIQIYGDYEMSAYDKSSQRLIAVAK